MGLLYLYQEDMFTASDQIHGSAGLKHAPRNATYLHDSVAFNGSAAIASAPIENTT